MFDDDYSSGLKFINEDTVTKSEALGFPNYYNIFAENDKLKLLNLKNAYPIITFKKLLKLINIEGTISPDGPIINTPSKISLDLKVHQKRTLYEMINKENSKYRYTSDWNVNLLCDDVGSGKSLCILSLIAHSPLAKLKTDLYYSSKSYTSSSGSHGQQWYGSGYDLQYTFGFGDQSTELESNLIVVPHNIFLQWKNYIETYSKLRTFYIGGKKDYTKFCSSKESVLKYTKKNDIVLIKSTMYKKFYSNMNVLFHDSEYASGVMEKITNETENQDITVKMKHEMRQIKQDMSKNYRNFMNIVGTGSTNEYKLFLKNKFQTTINKLQHLLDDYEWNDIGKEAHKRITPYKNNVNTFYFQRVIVDEVDSIKIPAFPYIYSKQIWYISSSINNIIYPYGNKEYNSHTGTYKVISSGIGGTGFLKEILANIFRSTSWGNHHIKLDTFRGLFSIIRNNNKFVQHSIHIPPPIINLIECYTPPHLYAIKNAINKDALKAFNAGDTKKAIEILGCKGGTEEDLIKQITQKLEDKQSELEKKIITKQKSADEVKVKIINLKKLLENQDIDAFTLSLFDNELEQSKKDFKNNKVVIKNTKEQIAGLKSKIAGIKERIANAESKNCPICYCPFAEPCITPCCSNIFCIECITLALSSSPTKECPLCRTHIDLKNLNLIINSTEPAQEEQEKEKLLSKLDNLLKIINNKPNKRYMIFSEYDASLQQIKEQLDSLSINYSGIKGAGSTIQNIISKFKAREFNVLLLNAKYFGAGLNLQFTDEIIIYHRMSKDLETQVIGRAQRLGRTEPLKINYLCYDNEYS